MDILETIILQYGGVLGVKAGILYLYIHILMDCIAIGNVDLKRY